MQNVETEIAERKTTEYVQRRSDWWKQQVCPGRDIRFLMRRNEVSIANLADQLGITQKRVRQIRFDGATCLVLRQVVEGIVKCSRLETADAGAYEGKVGCG